MRSKNTNILQAIILLTGIVYIATGLVFYISPLMFGRIFSIYITDDWVLAIQSDTFVAPLFFLSRAFAAMIFTCGAAMVLPLFDPLKYRALIYFTGIVFPVMSSFIAYYGGFSYDHIILLIYGTIFLAIFVLTTIGLTITNKQFRAGLE